MAPTSAWAAEQLTTFLTALSETADRIVLARRAVDLAAESLESEVAAFVADDRVVTAIGWPAGQVPEAQLVELTRTGGGLQELPGVGGCQVAVASFDGPTSGALLVGRLDEAPFAFDERNLLRAMSRVLDLSLRASQELLRERSLRSDSERQAAEYRQLLDAVAERQTLLERLTRIQRSISTGAPLDQVLDAIVSGARELLHCDVVTMRRLDADDASSVVVVASAGVDAASPLNTRSPIEVGLSGRAMIEEQLVVAEDYLHDTRGDEGTRALGIRVGMAAPVRENGVSVASLAVGCFDPTRRFSAAEQEILVSFAAHASLAITEAQTTDALRRALRDAQHDAMHDDLTGLPNRALLRVRLEQASRRRRQADGSIALLFLDLDNFKHVNDSLGHDLGDALLQAVAERLTESLRPNDTIARLGGDEFAVLVEGIDDSTEVREVAERLQGGLREPVSLAGRSVSVTASIGIATWDGEDDVHSLLRNADLAMYEAKRSGGDRHATFEASMHDRTMRRLDLEHDLRSALTNGEIVVHYQPIVDLATSSVCAVEALARWEHPERGLISPAEFIPVAETSHLIDAVGDRVLRLASAQAAAWPDDIRLSVNLSPRQIGACLPERLLSILAETGLAADRLTVEVTESLAMTHGTDMLDVLAQLREHGVRIAIDDFGTGYSSLARLRDLPIDILKIDRSFVEDVATNQGVAVLGAIFALSRAAGLTTVAEGVESDEQLTTLRMLGCNKAQGFLLGRPATPDALTALMADQSVRLVSPDTVASDECDTCAPDHPDDVLVFRRVRHGEWAHIGGRGRGMGWAGIVTVRGSADDAGVDLPKRPGEVVRHVAVEPAHVVGPYWARDAALVGVDHDMFVVLSDNATRISRLSDSELVALALAHMRTAVAATPAKRLADEMEIYNAVRDVTAMTSGTLPETLRHVAGIAADSLSCELAVIALDGGPGAVVSRDVEITPDDAEAMLRAVAELGAGVDEFVCTQNAKNAAVPPSLAAGPRVTAWVLVPLRGVVDGHLYVAHTTVRPRGFSNLCQRLAREIAAAAQTPLHVAMLREVVSGVPVQAAPPRTAGVRAVG